MTGFGLATLSDNQSTITIEVKSLNSKFQDFSIRSPKQLADFELEWRNLIGEKLERGKVTVAIDYQKVGKPEIKQTFNTELFQAYYAELKKLAASVAAQVDNQIFQLALSSPDVIQNNGREDFPAEEREKIKQTVFKAIAQCDNFRMEEGHVLGIKIKTNVEAIRVCLLEVERLDPARVEKIRHKLSAGVTEYVAQDKIDQNRLEQEIIFYIEKLDINEEKVRLKTHLDYFLQVMDAKESNGKKLSFIAQEIGREINTIGSKANDAGIQKQVVTMKEELEKIKEQLNNVL